MKIMMTVAALLIGAHANATNMIHCTLHPRMFFGNLYLNVDVANKTFAFSADSALAPEAKKDAIEVARGGAYVEAKDSMGFDPVWLCADEPCSGPGFVGHLKAADQATGHADDRLSYFDVNPLSATKIRYQSFGQQRELTGLSAFDCWYE